MERLSHIILVLAAVLLLAADEKLEKAKEPAPSAAQIQKWIKQLGDDDFKVREEATRDLIKANVHAAAAVSKATKSEDAEVKQRALKIIKQLEKVAIAYFEKLECDVTLDEKSPGKPVIERNLRSTQVTDSALEHLKGLTKLRTLFLRSTKITDLSPLKGLKNLEKLYLSDTPVTKQEIQKIQIALPNCDISWDGE